MATAEAERLTPRALVLELAALWLVVTAVLIVVVDLSRLSVPFVSGGDGAFYAMNIQTIIETGWVNGTSRLGAPFGQDLHDFPMGTDNGNFLLLALLAQLTSDWAVVLNLFFLLSFYLVATSGWLATRLLGAGGSLAMAIGVIFTFAHFHFERLPHLMLANYWSVPIGILLAIHAAQPHRSAWQFRRRWLASALYVLACVIVGSFGAYYAVFTVMTVAALCAASAIAHRSLRPLAHGGGICALIVLTVIVNVAGSIAWSARHGKNEVVGLRAIEELWLYRLRLHDLIRPIPDSRVLPQGPFAGLPGSPDSVGTALGLVGTAALLSLLIWTVAVVARHRMSSEDSVRGLLSFAAVLWLLGAVGNGWYTLVWLAGFHSLRATNRVSVLILFVALAWLALTLQRWVDRRAQGAPRRPVAIGVAAALIGAALLDQTPSEFPRGYDTAAAQHRANRLAFERFEQRLPERASVLELPIRRFPESVPQWGVNDYDLLVPFLYTDTMRFSYGGMKGREAEWQLALDRLSGTELVRAATAAGFDAILIDRRGYPDQARALTASLRSTLRTSPMAGLPAPWTGFALGSWHGAHRTSAADRDALLGRPRLNPGSCLPWEADPRNGEPAEDFWCPKSGRFIAVTPRPTSQSAATFALSTRRKSVPVELRWQGKVRTIDVGKEPTRVTLVVGKRRWTEIHFRTMEPALNPGRRGKRFLHIEPGDAVGAVPD